MKSRYEDSQRLLWNMQYACFFLTLLSIAEEILKREVDLIDSTRHCREQGWIDDEFTVKDDCKILSWLVGQKVRKDTFKSLDGINVGDDQYTLEKWISKDGKSNHFKRRYFDVYNNSRTVREGRFVCYYMYTVGD